MFGKALSLVVRLLPRGLFVAAAAAAWLDKPLHLVYFTLLSGLGFVMEIAENTASIVRNTSRSPLTISISKSIQETTTEKEST